MSLDPFFSLSPLSPRAYTYDAANPSGPYANAYTRTFGGYTDYSSPYSLEAQHTSDELFLYSDPVLSTDQTIASLADDLYRRCALRFQFIGTNVSTSNQYLLVFRLKGYSSGIAQFFIGSDFLKAQTLTGSYDDIAILLDVPGDNTWVYVNVRLAGVGTPYYRGLFYKGVDCYLL